MVRLIRKTHDTRTESGVGEKNTVIDLEMFEAFCELCGEVYFVDEDRFVEIHEVVRKTGENPFFCDACTIEYEMSWIS